MRIDRLIVIASCLLAAGAVSAQTIQSGQTVRKHRVAEESPSDTAVRMAEAAIEKHDLAAAEKSLRDAIAQDGNNYRAWFDLAFVLNAKGERAQSITAYRKSIAANPPVFESNLNLGLMLARDGDPEAEKYLRAATKLKPTSHPQQETARAYMALGRVLEKSNAAAAVEAFQTAAPLQPKDPAPHIAAATVLERAKQFATAEAEYKRAAEIDPKSPEALAGLVNIYIQTKRLSEAETSLRQYLTVDPNDAAAHAQLGRVLAASNRPEDAAKELQMSLSLSPDDPSIARQLSDLLIDSGKFADAKAVLSPLLQKLPNDATLHYTLGRALMQEHNYVAAQTELLTAVKLKGDLADAYGSLAVAANENKNYQLALQALNARAKFLEETPATYFLRATLFDHLNAKLQAIENYHLFLQSANGKYPDQEWKAKHRLIALEPKK